MPKYRAYQMNKEGRVLGLPDIITCDDDETAIKKAEPGQRQPSGSLAW
jgi:hypothetical protein